METGQEKAATNGRNGTEVASLGAGSLVADVPVGVAVCVFCLTVQRENVVSFVSQRLCEQILRHRKSRQHGEQCALGSSHVRENDLGLEGEESQPGWDDQWDDQWAAWTASASGNGLKNVFGDDVSTSAELSHRHDGWEARCVSTDTAQNRASTSSRRM